MTMTAVEQRGSAERMATFLGSLAGLAAPLGVVVAAVFGAWRPATANEYVPVLAGGILIAMAGLILLVRVFGPAPDPGIFFEPNQHRKWYAAAGAGFAAILGGLGVLGWAVWGLAA